MKADKAEGFMNKQGCDLVPTKQTISESERFFFFSISPGKRITILKSTLFP